MGFLKSDLSSKIPSTLTVATVPSTRSTHDGCVSWISGWREQLNGTCSITYHAVDMVGSTTYMMSVDILYLSELCSCKFACGTCRNAAQIQVLLNILTMFLLYFDSAVTPTTGGNCKQFKISVLWFVLGSQDYHQSCWFHSSFTVQYCKLLDNYMKIDWQLIFQLHSIHGFSLWTSNLTIASW